VSLNYICCSILGKFDNIWQINMAALYSAAQSLSGQFQNLHRN
jgi:hypothetical protein